MNRTIEVDSNGKIVGYSSVFDMASKWGIGDATIRLWIKRKKLDCIVIDGRHYIKSDTPKPELEKPGRKKESIQ